MEYFTILCYGISHVFLMLFIYFFISHRFSKKITILLCCLSAATISLLDICKLVVFANNAIAYIIITVLQIFITQFTALFISKKRSVRVLFLGLSASSYVIAGSIVTIVLRILTGNPLLALAGGGAVHLAFLIVLLVKVRDIGLKFQEKEYIKNCWGLCLIPIFFYCSFCFLAFFPHTLYDNPDNILGILFFIVTMLISYVIALGYMESEFKNNSIYWKNMLLESYVQGLENQQNLVIQAEKNLKILRHDMRHYCQIMTSLMEQKKYDKVEEVIEHIQNVEQENVITKYCNNLVVNIILVNMINKAQSFGIRTNLDILVPRKIPVNDYEFTLVVANLFENAIECVKSFEETRKNIKVKVHCTEDYLLVHTENEYQEEIELDSVTCLPQSRKKGNHGLGMQSALSFTEKIGGTIGCQLDEGTFQITIYAKF